MTKLENGKPITGRRMKEIIKQNKKSLSLYRGKFVAFDIDTGELVRWDNTELKIIQAIQRGYQNPRNLFVYAVPLVIK